MKKKYVIGVLLSIGLILLNQLIIQYALKSIRTNAKQINLAGRQRMLSQKINLEFYQLKKGDLSLAQVESTYSLWKSSHFALIKGDTGISLTAIESKEVITLLSKLNSNFETIQNSIIDYQNGLSIDLKKIDLNQSEFLTKMDLIVTKLENHSNKEVNFLIILEIILACFSVLLIAIEVRYIYFPQAEHLDQSNKKILKQNKVLKEIAWKQSHETLKPVASIIGFSDLLLNSNLEEEVKKEALQHLHASAKELDAIIEKIVEKTHSTEEKG